MLLLYTLRKLKAFIFVGWHGSRTAWIVPFVYLLYVQESWLNSKDSNDHFLRQWCLKGCKIFETFCFQCCKTLACDSIYYARTLHQDGEGMKHSERADFAIGSLQGKSHSLSQPAVGSTQQSILT